VQLVGQASQRLAAAVRLADRLVALLQQRPAAALAAPGFARGGFLGDIDQLPVQVLLDLLEQFRRQNLSGVEIGHSFLLFLLHKKHRRIARGVKTRPSTASQSLPGQNRGMRLKDAGPKPYNAARARHLLIQVSATSSILITRSPPFRRKISRDCAFIIAADNRPINGKNNYNGPTA